MNADVATEIVCMAITWAFGVSTGYTIRRALPRRHYRLALLTRYNVGRSRGLSDAAAAILELPKHSSVLQCAEAVNDILQAVSFNDPTPDEEETP